MKGMINVLEYQWDQSINISLQESISHYLSESLYDLNQFLEMSNILSEATITKDSNATFISSATTILNKIKDKVVEMFNNFIATLDSTFKVSVNYFKKHEADVLKIPRSELAKISYEDRGYKLNNNIPVVLSMANLGIPIIHATDAEKYADRIRDFIINSEEFLAQARQKILNIHIVNGQSFDHAIHYAFKSSHSTMKTVDSNKVKELVGSATEIEKLKTDLKQARQDFMNQYSESIRILRILEIDKPLTPKAQTKFMEYRMFYSHFMNQVLVSYIMIYHEKMSTINEKLNNDRKLMMKLVSIRGEGHK